MEKCPHCEKKQFNTSSKKCYNCGAEYRKDNSIIIVPHGYIKDSNDNIRTPNEYRIEDGRLHVSYHYILEDGKTTLRGDHQKLHSNQCDHPDRLDCNGGEGYSRCPHMKYNQDSRFWYCDNNIK